MEKMGLPSGDSVVLLGSSEGKIHVGVETWRISATSVNPVSDDGGGES